MIKTHALVSLPQRVLLLGAAASLVAVPTAGLGTAAAAATPAPPQFPPASTACVTGNGGFEQPAGLVHAGNLRTDIPAWHTTATDGAIEVWGPGNAGANGGEVAADTGTQFAELNGTQVSTLYQDVVTHPKTILVWRLAHRARSTSADDKDVIRVKIGTPHAQTAQIPLGQTSGDISDGGIQWGHYAGIYRVPKGQKVTRISIESVSSAAGSPSYGNFLDSFEVICTPPCPKKRFGPKACDALGLPLSPYIPVAKPRHPATPVRPGVKPPHPAIPAKPVTPVQPAVKPPQAVTPAAPEQPPIVQQPHSVTPTIQDPSAQPVTKPQPANPGLNPWQPTVQPRPATGGLPADPWQPSVKPQQAAPAQPAGTNQSGTAQSGTSQPGGQSASPQAPASQAAHAATPLPPRPAR
ncbi:hypothetical protein AB0M95_24795 [Sphaerisporangium sp. NPDC051017]|uniref:hypothetical protein n=1 Tax=Sphaerisporangium sp. NPDC051017 TaxID=3154636 RepID=UPI00341C8E7D